MQFATSIGDIHFGSDILSIRRNPMDATLNAILETFGQLVNIAISSGIRNHDGRIFDGATIDQTNNS